MTFVLRRAVLTAPLALAVPARAETKPGVRQVIAALRGPHPADLAGWDLSRLDLADLDMTGANLAGATLFGADLTDAKLVGCNLAGATLDRAIVIRTDFSGANLAGASFMLPAAFSQPGLRPAEDAPRFRQANLAGARVLAKFGAGDWTSANLKGAHFELGKLQFLAALRSDLSGCRLPGASLAGAVFTGVALAFADLRGADLSGADLRGADLAGAKLDDAILAGAQLSRADVHGASLRGVNLDQAEGVTDLRNLNYAER